MVTAEQSDYFKTSYGVKFIFSTGQFLDPSPSL